MARRGSDNQKAGKVTYLAQEKKKAQKKESKGRHSLLLNIFLLGFLAFAFFLFSAQYFQHLEAKNELNELETRLSALEDEKEALEEEVELLHDNEYLEMQARKHLGMVRPGEIIFFVGE